MRRFDSRIFVLSSDLDRLLFSLRFFNDEDVGLDKSEPVGGESKIPSSSGSGSSILVSYSGLRLSISVVSIERDKNKNN